MSCAMETGIDGLLVANVLPLDISTVLLQLREEDATALPEAYQNSLALPGASDSEFI
jgi:hypothetical protein